MLSGVFLALLTAQQGTALEITVTDEIGLMSVAIDWDGDSLDLFEVGSDWVAVVGIDVDAEHGLRNVAVALVFTGGERRIDTLDIEILATEFPTTRLEVEPGYVELSPQNQERAARESREIGAIYGRITPIRYWNEPFAVPLPGVTGGRNFGHRRIFNDQARAPHSGVDLRASTGTPVYASNSGQVVLATELFFSGNAVFLDHGLGVYSVYLHLSDIHVELGQAVQQGTVLGLAGATGRVTGPHLHWGVRILDARIDPFSLVQLGAE